MSQLQTFIKLIKSDRVATTDKLLFADLWHHGIESIPYINALRGGALKIYGVFHAGSYDPYDLLAFRNTEWWAEHFENMVCKITEKIFVGSEWSKRLLSSVRTVEEDKIVVTGLPLDCKKILNTVKNVKRSNNIKYVVFPHRIAPEKGIMNMIGTMEAVFEQSDDIRLMITSGKKNLRCRDPGINSRLQKFLKHEKVVVNTGLSKKDYYKLLAKCHVIFSSAFQETFGYGTLEAILCGCTPVVPYNLSYPDILQNDGRFTYLLRSEAIEKILKYCESPINVSEYTKRYDFPKVIGQMLKEMELIS